MAPGRCSRAPPRSKRSSGSRSSTSSEKIIPIIEYKAITSTGKSRKGIVDADTPRDARSKLRGDNMHVTEMWEVVDKKKNKNKKGKSTEKSVRKRRKTGQKPGGLLSMEI
ncbi:MAG: hypothetical protein MK138_04515, partial [Planctomycetes bacterium]|nr:hypothetical protein [Planctomycetota bacterium]